MREPVEVSLQFIRLHFPLFCQYCEIRRLVRALDPGVRVDVEIVKFLARYIAGHHRAWKHIPVGVRVAPAGEKILVMPLRHDDVRNQRLVFSR